MEPTTSPPSTSRTRTNLRRDRGSRTQNTATSPTSKTWYPWSVTQSNTDPRVFIKGLSGWDATLLAQERIEKLFQDGPGNDTRARGQTVALVRDDVGRCRLHGNLVAQCPVLIDIGIEGAALSGLRSECKRRGPNRRVARIPAALHLALHALELRGGHSPRNVLFDVSIHRPCVLVVVQSRFHGLKFPDSCRGIQPASSLVTVFVHRQWIVAMNQVHFSRCDVVGNHLTQGRLKQISAGRALIVAEYFHGDRGIAGAVCLHRHTQRRDSLGRRNRAGMRRRRSRGLCGCGLCGAALRTGDGRNAWSQQEQSQQRAHRAQPSGATRTQSGSQRTVWFVNQFCLPTIDRNLFLYCNANCASDDHLVPVVAGDDAHRQSQR